MVPLIMTQFSPNRGEQILRIIFVQRSSNKNVIVKLFSANREQSDAQEEPTAALHFAPCMCFAWTFAFFLNKLGPDVLHATQTVCVTF